MIGDEKIRVGLCGVGDRLDYVAQTFQKLVPGFDVVGFAEPDPKRQELIRAGDRFGRAFDSLEELLAEADPDLVMIASPNAEHFHQIELALKAGKLVWTEKPVVATIEQTFQMLDLVRTYGADRIIVGLVLRYSPLYRALMESKTDGLFGDIVSIEASEHIPPEHGAFFMRDWRRNASLSGGFLLEKCCHDLDIYQSLVGARPIRVASFGGRGTFLSKNEALEDKPVYHERKSRWGGKSRVFDDTGDIVDHQVALIEYANGVKLSFHTNLNTPDEFRRFCVIGSRGMAEGDFVKNYFRAHDAVSAAKTRDTSFNYDDGISIHYGAEEKMAAEMAAFLYEGAPLPVSVTDALEAGVTAMAIDQARCTGTVIDLTEIWERFDAAQRDDGRKSNLDAA